MGGGAPSIPQRSWPKEWGDIKGGYKGQINQYLDFIAKDPLLSQAYPFALQMLKDVPGLQAPLQNLLGGLPKQFGQWQTGLTGIGNELKGIQAGIPGQFANWQGQLGNLYGQIPGLQNQLSGYQGQLGNLFGQLPGLQRQLQGLQNQLPGYQNRLGQIGGTLGGLASSIPGLQSDIGGYINRLNPLVGSQQRVYQGLQPILNRQGALTNEQGRNVDQATRAGFAARGNVLGNQALGSELLNRDQYRQQRFSDALQQSLGLSGSISGLTGQQAGLTGQQAGLTGLRANLLGQQAGVTGQQAGLTGLGANLLGQQGNFLNLGAGLLGQGANMTGQQGNLLGLGAGITGQQAGLTGQEAQILQSLLGQRAGIIGQGAGLLGAQAGLTSGLTSGIQGLGMNALNSLLGTERAGVGSFSQLTNPILAYLSDLNSSNQNAAAAQNIAGANKSGGAAGAGIGAIGSIIGAVLPLLFSDKQLKENITSTGRKTPEGIPVKRWNYKGDDRMFEGVVAQDVEKKAPWAVMLNPLTEHKMVNTGAINAPFKQIRRAA